MPIMSENVEGISFIISIGVEVEHASNDLQLCAVDAPYYTMYSWTITTISPSVMLLCGKGLESEEDAVSSHDPSLSRRSDLIEFFQTAPIGLHCIDGMVRRLHLFC